MKTGERCVMELWDRSDGVDSMCEFKIEQPGKLSAYLSTYTYGSFT